MSARGLYKKGYYLTLLHSLELYYGLESARVGPEPERWQPLPRRRADQFLRFVVDTLAEVEKLPEGYADFVELLAASRLSRVATALDFVVRRKLKSPRKLEGVLKRLSGGKPPSTQELYPQARKLGQFLRQHLDPLWKEALLATSREGWPRVSVILGGLPPGFSRTYSQVTRALAAQQVDALSVAQFYGLATGGLEAPPQWQPVLDKVADLPADALSLIKNLSEAQLEQLATLEPAAVKLVIQFRSLRRATPHWRTLVTELSGLANASDETLATTVTSWQRRYSVNIRQPGEVLRLIRPTTWQVVEGLDEELIRMIDRRELTLALVKQLQDAPLQDNQAQETGQTADLLPRMRRVLRDDWVWLSAFSEDRAQLARLARLRTPAQARLRDLFPQTVSWLDAQFLTHRQELLLRDLYDVSEYAGLYAAQVVRTLTGQHGNASTTRVGVSASEPEPAQMLLETFKAQPAGTARGRVYPQWLILSLATLAKLCAQTSFVGMARFTARHPELLTYLRFTHERLPSHDTFRYTLSRCSKAQFEASSESWARWVLSNSSEEGLERTAQPHGKDVSYMTLLRQYYRGFVARATKNKEIFDLEFDLLGAVVAAELLTSVQGVSSIITPCGTRYRVNAT